MSNVCIIGQHANPRVRKIRYRDAEADPQGDENSAGELPTVTDSLPSNHKRRTVRPPEPTLPIPILIHQRLLKHRLQLLHAPPLVLLGPNHLHTPRVPAIEEVLQRLTHPVKSPRPPLLDSRHVLEPHRFDVPFDLLGIRPLRAHEHRGLVLRAADLPARLRPRPLPEIVIRRPPRGDAQHAAGTRDAVHFPHDEVRVLREADHESGQRVREAIVRDALQVSRVDDAGVEVAPAFL